MRSLLKKLVSPSWGERLQTPRESCWSGCWLWSLLSRFRQGHLPTPFPSPGRVLIYLQNLPLLLSPSTLLCTSLLCILQPISRKALVPGRRSVVGCRCRGAGHWGIVTCCLLAAWCSTCSLGFAFQLHFGFTLLQPGENNIRVCYSLTCFLLLSHPKKKKVKGMHIG